MGNKTEPLILFIPGKNPKPVAEAHQEQLFRCLKVGMQRAGSSLVDRLAENSDWFEILPWNELFYGRSSDIMEELPWVDRLLAIDAPTAKDIRDAHAWRTRLAWIIYSIADRMPVLIPLIANPAIRSTIKETLVYFRNTDGIGESVRKLLKNRLLTAFADNRPVLIIGHSMGSVIAFDALWQMSHVSKVTNKVSQFLTIGSPLGLRFVQKRLLGANLNGAQKYPTNIRNWVNVSAMGELTALDREFADDYHEMVALGLLDSIHDQHKGVYNYYRDDNGLNVHRSYGYLVNPVTGKVIADWLKSALANGT